jgi:small-conductance mechanosensitive channel
MDKQQQVNLGVYQRFERESIEFAFPTRTLHVAGTPDPRNERPEGAPSS